MTQTVIRTERLSKDYGNGKGCRDITLTVRAGETFGFLGPNGAGKSTLVKMVIGLIHPDSGTAEVFGHRAGSLQARRHLGYLPELFRYPAWMSGEEVVRLYARLSEMKDSEIKQRVPRVLQEVGLMGRGQDRTKHYSKGMQQRLGLACALVHDPDVLILDEPASALDPIGRHEVRQLLKRWKAQGKTIFLNSHLLEDVEMLCDRVALLNHGTIIKEGTVEDVLEKKGMWHLRVGGLLPEDLDWLREMTERPLRVLPVDDEPENSSKADLPVAILEAELENEEQLAWLNRLVTERGISLFEVRRKASRLDEWFLRSVTGGKEEG